MRSLVVCLMFLSLGVFYLPSSVFASASLSDYWQGKADWKLINKFTLANTGWDYGYGAGAHINIVGNNWYLFGRKYWWNQGTDCPGGQAMGTVVRKSTDGGLTWSAPVDIISPLAPGSPWECGAIDGDAFYNATENKWHYLFQCESHDNIWNGCEVQRAGNDPMGPFQQTHANPVIKGGLDKGLWKDICTDPSKDCYNISGGNNVFDAGTFNIFDYSGGFYYVGFHGFDGQAHGEHSYRGIAKTADFTNWIAGNSSQGVPSDAVLDKNDAGSFRESWQGEGSKGFGAGSILSDGGYYYLISEAVDISLACNDGQNWDWGIFRSNSLTNTHWEEYPLGNPILYSSKKPERNNKSIACNPGFTRIFRDPTTQKIYLHTTRESIDQNNSGIFLYELVPSSNLLQNGNLWKCNTDNWQRISAGGNTTNMVIYRYPNESSDANCFLSTNCGGSTCAGGQSIYQDVDVSNIPFRNIAYGGKFATAGGTGNLLLDLFEFDQAGKIINENKTTLTAGDSYQSTSNGISLNSQTKKVRFQLYLLSNNNFKADEMFVEPVSSLSSPMPSSTSVPGSSVTSVLFNGGVSPETAKALDLTGTNATSTNLTNHTGNIYSAQVDVVVSTGSTQETRHLSINFNYQPTATPVPSGSGVFEKGLEAGEQHDTSKVALVSESGAKWVRLNFVGNDWSVGSNDVNTYNTIINEYLGKNIKIIGLIGAQSVSGGYDRNNPGAFTQKFTDEADSIVSRFGDRVKVYELFNEPNDWAGGSSSQVPERYFAEYLASIYQKIKIEKGKSDIFLNSGPLFSFDQNNGASYLQGTYAAGKNLAASLNWDSIKSQTGSYPLDGVDYHIYVAQGLFDQGQVEAKVLANLNAISNIINTNDPGKRIWITELGWGTGQGRVTEEVQAANLGKAFGVLKNQPIVRMAMWFTLTDFDSSEWGLIRTNGSKKLAWTSFQQVSSPTPTSIPTSIPSATPTFGPSSRPSIQPDVPPTPGPSSSMPSPSISPSPTPTPLPDQEYIVEPELPDENPNFPPLPSQAEIRAILFGSQPIDPSGQSPLSIHLIGQPGKPTNVLLPLNVTYSQGSTKNVALQFNYVVADDNEPAVGTRGTVVNRTVGSGSVRVSGNNLNQQKFDLNSDKMINSLDVGIFFTEWRNNLTGGTVLKADFNGDKVINSIDYAMLKNLMGKKV